MLKTPAIFYSPHQDDEAIGMAGAIAEHKAVGRPVILVLLTDGHPSLNMQNKLRGFNLTIDQMIWARTVEFMASAQALKADRVLIAGTGGISDHLPGSDYAEFVNQVCQVIMDMEHRYPASSHKLVSGVLEANEHGGPSLTHKGCWEAAEGLRSHISDFRFYRVYEYYKPKEERQGTWRRKLKPEWLQSKRAALGAYRYVNTARGRYGYGNRSVPGLIDAAYSDDHEYIDVFD